MRERYSVALAKDAAMGDRKESHSESALGGRQRGSGAHFVGALKSTNLRSKIRHLLGGLVVYQLLTLLTILAFALFNNGVARAGAWEELDGSATGGGVSNNTGHSSHPSLALDSLGNPHIAWDNYSGSNYEIYYVHWDGNSWETYGGANVGGGVSSNAFDSYSPSLALDGNGYPHIAWGNNSSGGFEIYYAYWDGTQWTTYGGANTGGGVSNNAGTSFSPSLALDSNGYPHIAWQDDSYGDVEIYYAYWNGSNWVTHGSGNTDGGVSNNAGNSYSPSLALNGSDYPHIAWDDDSGGSPEIYYAHWDGDSWETYGGANTDGGVSNNAGNSFSPSLALDSNGYPHIAWDDDSGGSPEIYYAYWNGSNWTTYSGGNIGGEVSNSADLSCVLSLAPNGSANPHIVREDVATTITPTTLIANSTPTTNPISNNTTTTTTGTCTTTFMVPASLLPSLALDSSNNPHIAWQNYSGLHWNIHYAYWDSAQWTTHGNANTGGGVSNYAGWSDLPSLALDSSGYLHITWAVNLLECEDRGNREIYYRRWNPAGVTTTTTTTSTTTSSTTTTTTSTTTTITTSTTTTTTLLCHCPADSFTACVSGQVTNTEGKPLTGKPVRFKGRLFPGGPGFEMKTRTDDNGCYQFNLPEGIGKIRVKRCRGGGKKDVSVPFGGKVNDMNFECKKKR